MSFISYYEKNEALKLVKCFETNDPFELADYLNLHVFFKPLHPDIMGFYKYYKKNKYICISSELDYHEQVATCAHELCHSELHEKINTPYLRKNTFLSVEKYERQANLFAAELLIPDYQFKMLAEEFNDFKKMSIATGIPEEYFYLKYQKNKALLVPCYT